MIYAPDRTYTLAELRDYSQAHGYVPESESLTRHLQRKASMDNGHAAQLLDDCGRAVKVAARKVETLYNVPSVSADERADYAAELALAMLGRDAGPGYLVKRAQGMILNDRERRTEPLGDGATLTLRGPVEPSGPEAGHDPRLDGPLSVPEHVAELAERLDVSQTARRALIAAMVPATRQEWADFYGYASANAWHVTDNRGRAELYSIGEDAIRQAIAQTEA